jgi:GcrA cell cycle regulator
MTDTSAVTPNHLFVALDVPKLSRQGQRGPSAHEFHWTEERIETLRTMWADGKSQMDIASALGTTRGSVSGKIDRLNLPQPVFKQTSATHLNRPKFPRRRPHEQIAMPEGRITFDELTRENCHFPVGDALPYLYCGEPTPIAPYCARCSAIATAPLRV